MLRLSRDGLKTTPPLASWIGGYHVRVRRWLEGKRPSLASRSRRFPRGKIPGGSLTRCDAGSRSGVVHDDHVDARIEARDREEFLEELTTWLAGEVAGRAMRPRGHLERLRTSG